MTPDNYCEISGVKLPPDDRTQRYKEAAALIRSWLNDSNNDDTEIWRKMEPYLKRLDYHGEYERGRYIICRGCPTVECTCLTELEDALLNRK